MDNRAAIAMSGGVDSSVAALLTKEKGFDCIAVTMKLFHNEDVPVSDEHSCCSDKDVEDARSIAYSLNMPHYVLDFSDRFRADVIDRFTASYESGLTPNPCIDCNRYLKFKKLFLRAEELDSDFVVTGHYARIEFDRRSDRYLLKKSADSSKDQSYVLYTMTQHQLAHTMFPLGEMCKDDVRRIAHEHGFINAKKHDSQDICFVQNGNYADFIENYLGKTYPPGDFVDIEGNVLGQHRGIIRYTVGQRHGLGIAAETPLYVISVNPESNTVVIGKNEELYSKSLNANHINLISTDRIDRPIRVKAKIRYRQAEQPATVVQTGDDTIAVEFDSPQRAVTKGQAVVLYDGDTVVGGGTIQ